MSKRPYGPIIQSSFVVRDIDEAIREWVDVMNVGPFLKVDHVDFVEAEYRGRAAPLDIAIALAYSGDHQIEVVKPLGPSVFQEFLDAGRTGVQHFSVLARDFAMARADLESRGGEMVQGGIVRGGSEVGYFAMPGDDGILMEVAALKQEFLDMYDHLKAAAAAWDGKTRTVAFA